MGVDSEPAVISEGTNFVVEVQQAETPPIDSRIPDILRNHYPRIAQQTVLLLVDVEPRIRDIEIGIVVGYSSLSDVLAIHLSAHQVGDEAVADSNKIGAWRVEWIGKNPRLSREAPAIT